MQARKVGLKKVRDLGDMIGRGAEITPIERPYMKLADDPRVLAYSDLDAASFTQLGLRLATARQFKERCEASGHTGWCSGRTCHGLVGSRGWGLRAE